MTTPYSGFLHKDGDGVAGRLVDTGGSVISLTGTPGEQDGKRGYVLTGTVWIPEWLRFPGDEYSETPP